MLKTEKLWMQTFDDKAGRKVLILIRIKMIKFCIFEAYYDRHTHTQNRMCHHFHKMLKAELLVIFSELTPGVAKFNVVIKLVLNAQLCVVFKYFIPPCLLDSCRTLSENHCVCKKKMMLWTRTAIIHFRTVNVRQQREKTCK